MARQLLPSGSWRMYHLDLIFLVCARVCACACACVCVRVRVRVRVCLRVPVRVHVHVSFCVSALTCGISRGLFTRAHFVHALRDSRFYKSECLSVGPSVLPSRVFWLAKKGQKWAKMRSVMMKRQRLDESRRFQVHFFFIRTLFIRTSSLRFSKNQEHPKNIAEPQIIEKLRTSQPQKFKIRTNIGNYANLRKISID